MDCDLGIERGISVHADYIYVEVIKQGLNYKAISGKMKILKIGIPELIKKVNSGNLYILEKHEYTKQFLCKRDIYGHKGNYGRALVVAKGFTEQLTQQNVSSKQVQD